VVKGFLQSALPNAGHRGWQCTTAWLPFEQPGTWRGCDHPNSHGARLRSIFEDVDVSGAGAIHIESLENLLTDTMVKYLPNDMDIDASEVAGTFKLLDVHDGGYVNIDELMITLFRLQASSQVVDLPSLVHESRKVGCHLVKATQASDCHISELKEALSQVQTLQSQSFAVLLNLQASEPSGRA